VLPGPLHRGSQAPHAPIHWPRRLDSFDSRHSPPHSWTPTVSQHTNATVRTGLFTQPFYYFELCLAHEPPPAPLSPSERLIHAHLRQPTFIHLPDTDGTRRHSHPPHTRNASSLFAGSLHVFDGASSSSVEQSSQASRLRMVTAGHSPPHRQSVLVARTPRPHPSSSASHSTCPLCPPELLTPHSLSLLLL